MQELHPPGYYCDCCKKGQKCACHCARFTLLVVYHIVMWVIFLGLLTIFIAIAYHVTDKDIPVANINAKRQQFLQIPGLSTIPSGNDIDSDSIPTIGYSISDQSTSKDKNLRGQEHIDKLEKFIDKAAAGSMYYSYSGSGDKCKSDQVACPFVWSLPASTDPSATATLPEGAASATEAVAGCTADNMFGYNSKSPCVVVKLNKIFGWMPNLFKSEDELPAAFTSIDPKYKTKFAVGSIPISCEPQTAFTGKKFQGKFASADFYPPTGIEATCFPSCAKKGKDQYVSPFVMVRFINTDEYAGDAKSDWDEKLTVPQCLAWTKNMGDHSEEQKADMTGSLTFAIKQMP